MSEEKFLLPEDDLGMVSGGVHHRKRKSLNDKAEERMRKRSSQKNEASLVATAADILSQ